MVKTSGVRAIHLVNITGIHLNNLPKCCYLDNNFLLFILV